jgi:hypothetical protein
MRESHVMTCKAFAGYLQCQTKGQLLWRSGRVEPDFIEMVTERFKLASVAQIQTSIGRHLISYEELSSAKCDKSFLDKLFLIDCDTTYLDIRTTHIPKLAGAKTKPESEDSLPPILFTVPEPLEPWHKTPLSFAAIANGASEPRTSLSVQDGATRKMSSGVAGFQSDSGLQRHSKAPKSLSWKPGTALFEPAPIFTSFL